MGRYYTTSSGRDGKFGFGCQSSSDPADFFGMEEQVPTEIDYYISAHKYVKTSSGKDKDRLDMKVYKSIKQKVDQCYDRLEILVKDRIYYQPYEQTDALEKLILEAAFIDIPRQEYYATREQGTAHNGMVYGSSKGDDYVSIEAYEGAFLDVCRIRLGVTILSDLKDSHECYITAEM